MNMKIGKGMIFSMIYWKEKENTEKMDVLRLWFEKNGFHRVWVFPPFCRNRMNMKITGFTIYVRKTKYALDKWIFLWPNSFPTYHKRNRELLLLFMVSRYSSRLFKHSCCLGESLMGIYCICRRETITWCK